jgi:hypothetical protein
MKFSEIPRANWMLGAAAAVLLLCFQVFRPAPLTANVILIAAAVVLTGIVIFRLRSK